MFKGIFSYPQFHISDESYQTYWRNRKITNRTFNSFQKRRVALSVPWIETESTLLDIGCGNGMSLVEVSRRKKMKKLIGVDFSPEVLDMAKQNEIEVIQADISKAYLLKDLPPADYIFMFEVLEHLANSEELLIWAMDHATKGVFFSVPNTGYFKHRLRLLFGRFPLQWRVRPNEHLRFWTVRDMHWWLKHLCPNYILRIYEGPQFLRKIWPSLFGAGIWVFIPANS